MTHSTPCILLVHSHLSRRYLFVITQEVRVHLRPQEILHFFYQASIGGCPDVRDLVLELSCFPPCQKLFCQIILAHLLCNHHSISRFICYKVPSHPETHTLALMKVIVVPVVLENHTNNLVTHRKPSNEQFLVEPVVGRRELSRFEFLDGIKSFE